MKKSVKLMPSFTAFLAANMWLIFKGAAKGSADYFISPVVEETILFILLQLFVIVVYFIRPLTIKKAQLIYWCVSEAFVLSTIFFWGIFIVGPIWLKAIPNKERLASLHRICLQIFRHLAQKILDGRQPACEFFVQPDEKSDCASSAQSLFGIALNNIISGL